MIVTNEQGNRDTTHSLDMDHKILRAAYHEMDPRKENITDKAATLKDDAIRSMVIGTSKYLKVAEMADSDLVPPLLLRLLSRIISSKSKVQNTAQRQRIAKSHSITQAVRPRSFISPILLAIGVHVNTQLESRVGRYSE